MTQEGKQYYERELAFISSQNDPLSKYFAQQFPAEAAYASRFRKQYPVKAGSMELPKDMSIDPHVEWWIQGSALLAGRVHKKIADEFAQLPEEMLALFYPHLLMPIPSMAVVQFAQQNPNFRKSHIPQGSALATNPVGNPPTECHWRTGYDVDLWPIKVVEAELQQAVYFDELPVSPTRKGVLRLRFECEGDANFADLSLDSLRVFLNSDPEVVASLYELLFSHTEQVYFRDADRPQDPLVLLTPAECIEPAGFRLCDELLPFPPESFVGYRLLTEFFAFPEKFWFVDLRGFDRIAATKRIEILFSVSEFPENVANALDASIFQLGCTPIVNLFHRIAEPIDWSHTQPAYKVIPGRGFAKNGIEVFSVDKVSSFEPNAGKITDFQRFYDFPYNQDRHARRAFWYGDRRASHHKGVHTRDVWLTLVDLDFDPNLPAEQAVNVHVTCSNGELPFQFLRVGTPLFLQERQPGFQGGAELVIAPTRTRRPPLEKASFWRWLSQAALGHVPLAGVDGLDALKETLLLCASAYPHTGRTQHETVIDTLIDGVTGFQSRRITHSYRRGQRVCTCRGMEFTLELDLRNYIGTGAILFACLLERFLGLYISVNSFSRLVLKTKQGEGIVKEWPPRAAENILK